MVLLAAGEGEGEATRVGAAREPLELSGLLVAAAVVLGGVARVLLAHGRRVSFWHTAGVSSATF